MREAAIGPARRPTFQLLQVPCTNYFLGCHFRRGDGWGYCQGSRSYSASLIDVSPHSTELYPYCVSKHAFVKHHSLTRVLQYLYLQLHIFTTFYHQSIHTPTMWLLSLLSLAVFIIPIWVTFGAFFAVEHQKILDCGLHCGVPGQGGFPGAPGGGNTPSGSDLPGSLYCMKTYAITPDPGQYVFNPNQWGDPEDTGSLCLNVSTQ